MATKSDSTDSGRETNGFARHSADAAMDGQDFFWYKSPMAQKTYRRPLGRPRKPAGSRKRSQSFSLSVDTLTLLEEVRRAMAAARSNGSPPSLSDAVRLAIVELHRQVKAGRISARRLRE